MKSSPMTLSRSSAAAWVRCWESRIYFVSKRGSSDEILGDGLGWRQSEATDEPQVDCPSHARGFAGWFQSGLHQLCEGNSRAS